MAKIRDLQGENFGKLTVIAYAGISASRRVLWRVRCDCGNEKVTPGYVLVAGDTTSCGCGKRTHGCTGTKEYQAWTNMIHRCETEGYKDHHGRGITVCKAWRESFEAFLSDVGPAPSPDHTLDRENNDGHYEPGNVRWATWSQQLRNTRRTCKLPYRGKTYSKAGLAELVGLPREVVRARLRLGWSIEAAVETPYNPRSLKPLAGL